MLELSEVDHLKLEKGYLSLVKLNFFFEFSSFLNKYYHQSDENMRKTVRSIKRSKPINLHCHQIRAKWSQDVTKNCVEKLLFIEIYWGCII